MVVNNLYGYWPRLTPFMTKSKEPNERKTSGELLRELRERRGMSLREAAKLAGLSHGTIVNAETRGISSAQTNTLQGLARAYGVSDSVMSSIAKGVNPFALGEGGSEERPARHLEVHPEWVPVPVYGTISAGDDEPTPLSDKIAYIPREHLKRRGSSQESIRTYLVNGSCMVSEEARRVEKNFAPGDYVAVDFMKSYDVGDVVAAWWEDQHTLIIKRYKIEKENIVLYPLSAGRPSVVLPAEDQVQIIGPVVWRGG